MIGLRGRFGLVLTTNQKVGSLSETIERANEVSDKTLLAGG
jgi:hypothetical protein